jgi:hypothetical protein
MPNALKGETLLNLGGGREFTLVLDHEAIILAADAYGKGFAEMLADSMPPEDADGNIVGHPKYGAIRALLFGALNYHHPDITLRDASALLLDNMEAVTAALAEAGERGLPKVEDNPEGKQGSRPPRRGKNSGRSGAKSGSTRKPSGGQRRAATN